MGQEDARLPVVPVANITLDDGGIRVDGVPVRIKSTFRLEEAQRIPALVAAVDKAWAEAAAVFDIERFLKEREKAKGVHVGGTHVATFGVTDKRYAGPQAERPKLKGNALFRAGPYVVWSEVLRAIYAEFAERRLDHEVLSHWLQRTGRIPSPAMAGKTATFYLRFLAADPRAEAIVEPSKSDLHANPPTVWLKPLPRHGVEPPEFATPYQAHDAERPEA